MELRYTFVDGKGGINMCCDLELLEILRNGVEDVIMARAGTATLQELLKMTSVYKTLEEASNSVRENEKSDAE